MDWFCKDVVLGFVGDPEYYLFEGCVIVVGYADDFLVSFLKVDVLGLVFQSRVFPEVVDAVEGECENFACVVGRCNEKPAVVVFFQKMRNNVGLVRFGVYKGMIINCDGAFRSY